MAQSIDSILRVLEFIWNQSTNDIPYICEKRVEKFPLPVIAKISVEVDDIINPTERKAKQAPNPEQPAENEDANGGRQKDINKFNGQKIGDYDKTRISQLYQALGREAQKILPTNNQKKNP